MVSCLVAVVTITFDTDAILGNASPRNPIVAMEARSRSERNLLVVWRSNANSRSARLIPSPSSATRINPRPPSLMSMEALNHGDDVQGTWSIPWYGFGKHEARVQAAV